MNRRKFLKFGMGSVAVLATPAVIASSELKIEPNAIRHLDGIQLKGWSLVEPFNTKERRLHYVNLVDKYLNYMIDEQKIMEYLVTDDYSDNNNPDVMEIDIFVKPVATIEYIEFNVKCTDDPDLCKIIDEGLVKHTLGLDVDEY